MYYYLLTLFCYLSIQELLIKSYFIYFLKDPLIMPDNVILKVTLEIRLSLMDEEI